MDKAIAEVQQLEPLIVHMLMIYERAPELEMGPILRQCRQDYQLGEALGNPLPQLLEPRYG